MQVSVRPIGLCRHEVWLLVLACVGILYLHAAQQLLLRQSVAAPILRVQALVAIQFRV